MVNTDSFLGRGWSFPPAFDPVSGQVIDVADEQNIQESLEVLLGTRPGQRLADADYGCDLSNYLFEEVDQVFVRGMKEIVTEAVLFGEPRVRPNDVTVEETEPGKVLITIHYTIRASNSRHNLVYPFYVNEGNQVNR